MSDYVSQLRGIPEISRFPRIFLDGCCKVCECVHAFIPIYFLFYLTPLIQENLDSEKTKTIALKIASKSVLPISGCVECGHGKGVIGLEKEPCSRFMSCSIMITSKQFL